MSSLEHQDIDRVVITMHRAVHRRKGKPFARLLSFNDIVKQHDHRISYDVHWRNQPPQPTIHSVDFEEPEVLHGPNRDICDTQIPASEMYPSDDESSSMSAASTLAYDEDECDHACSVSPPPSSRCSMSTVKPTTPTASVKILSMQKILAPYEYNFWYRLGHDRLISWYKNSHRLSDDGCSGALARSQTLCNSSQVDQHQPTFLIGVSDASKAIKPFMCVSNGSCSTNTATTIDTDNIMKWHLWKKCNHQTSAMQNRVSFELHLYQEQLQAHCKVQIPIARFNQTLDTIQYMDVESLLSLDHTNTTNNNQYMEHASMALSPIDIMRTVLDLAVGGKRRTNQYPHAGLELLDTPSRTLERFSMQSKRFYLRCTFNSAFDGSGHPTTPSSLCTPWISDPFSFCTHRHSSPRLNMTLTETVDAMHCWMQQFCHFTNIFFAEALMACQKQQQHSSATNNFNYCAPPVTTIPFNSMFNFLQYLVVRMTPKSFKPHILDAKQVWQFMIESCLVQTNYHLVTSTRVIPPSNSPYGTISFDTQHVQKIDTSNHMHLARQACESLSQSVNGQLCRVDLTICHRVIYPFAKLLFHMRDYANCSLVNKLWSNGFVALASPPMIHVLDSRAKCWFNLEPCKPHVVELQAISQLPKPSSSRVTPLDWTHCVALPKETSIYSLFLEESPKAQNKYLGLWCGELGNIALESTSDAKLIKLLRDLRLRVFYGTDNTKNVIKRSLVSMLLPNN